MTSSSLSPSSLRYPWVVVKTITIISTIPNVCSSLPSSPSDIQIRRVALPIPIPFEIYVTKVRNPMGKGKGNPNPKVTPPIVPIVSGHCFQCCLPCSSCLCYSHSPPSPLVHLSKYLYSIYGHNNKTQNPSSSSPHDIHSSLILFSFKYLDSDGDECAIESDSELMEAIKLATEKDKTLKIYVKIGGNNENNRIPNKQNIEENDDDEFDMIDDVTVTFDSDAEVDNDNDKKDKDFPLHSTENKNEIIPIPSIPISTDSFHQFVSIQNRNQNQSPNSPSLIESETKEFPIVHVGFQCDECGMSPIVGWRFRCVSPQCQSNDFDLCPKCEQWGKHPKDHTLMKIYTPISNKCHENTEKNLASPSCSPSPSPPLCVFVSDVTFPRGSFVSLSEEVRKVWKVQNSGKSKWPMGTKIRFISGEIVPIGIGKGQVEFEVPSCLPNDFVHISVDVKIHLSSSSSVPIPFPFMVKGEFRLVDNEGKPFGERLECNFNTENNSEKEKEKEKDKGNSHPYPSTNQSMDINVHVDKNNQNAINGSQSLASSPSFLSSSLFPPLSLFPFSLELSSLTSMGFLDLDFNKYLLINNKGDINKCINLLTTNNK